MTSRVTSVREAYAAFGLVPGDGPDAAKSAFRSLVKTLHPDVTPPTHETLSRLAQIVAAMELIKATGPCQLELTIAFPAISHPAATNTPGPIPALPPTTT